MRKKTIYFVIITLVLAIIAIMGIDRITRRKIVSFEFSSSSMMVSHNNYYLAEYNKDLGNVRIEGGSGFSDDTVVVDESFMEELETVVNKHSMHMWFWNYNILDSLNLFQTIESDQSRYEITIKYASGRVVKSQGKGSYPKNFGEAQDDIVDLFTRQLEK